jgi:class 3 adenylate cyclase
MFTDIVGSTERAAALGDRAWRDLLQDHHILVRRELARFRGEELDTAVTASLRSSTALRVRSPAPALSSIRSASSTLRSAPTFTPASASCRTER